MLKALLKKIPLIFASQKTEGYAGELTLTTKQHGLSSKQFNKNAAKVIYQFIDNGYEGYLVGGCVRDALLKLQPKDFDVVTNASPEQAHTLFRNSRLIGRRFKLLHVLFGREILEVATFRASPTQDTNNQTLKKNAQGMLTRDNVYGNIEEDAQRRDFTVNALYYCLENNSIRDFTGGYQDIKKGLIRIIGDPNERYPEDPVRMLRAVRFAAKLNFKIEAKTAAPIKELSPLLARISSARLFDESLKLFQSGYAEHLYQPLRDFNLFAQLLPQTEQALVGEQGKQVEKLILHTMRNTDKRINQGKSITPAFMFAALLWPSTQAQMNHLKPKQKNMPAMEALHKAANQVLSEQCKSTAIPKRFTVAIREIWELQILLNKRNSSSTEQPRFRAAYDLVLLREKSGEDLQGLGQWWTDYQRENPVAPRRAEYKKPRRRRS